MRYRVVVWLAIFGGLGAKVLPAQSPTILVTVGHAPKDEAQAIPYSELGKKGLLSVSLPGIRHPIVAGKTARFLLMDSQEQLFEELTVPLAGGRNLKVMQRLVWRAPEGIAGNYRPLSPGANRELLSWLEKKWKKYSGEEVGYSSLFLASQSSRQHPYFDIACAHLKKEFPSALGEKRAAMASAIARCP